MKLKKFIKKLEKIRDEHGEDTEVVMADFIPIVEPVFLPDKNLGNNIVITDRK